MSISATGGFIRPGGGGFCADTISVRSDGNRSNAVLSAIVFLLVTLLIRDVQTVSAQGSASARRSPAIFGSGVPEPCSRTPPLPMTR